MPQLSRRQFLRSASLPAGSSHQPAAGESVATDEMASTKPAVGYSGEETVDQRAAPVATGTDRFGEAKPGMRYLVFTARDHDEYSMLHSNADPCKVLDATPSKRNVLAELAEAWRGTKVKRSVCDSQCVDWNEPHGGKLPDGIKPKHENAPDCIASTWGNGWDLTNRMPEGFAECPERNLGLQDPRPESEGRRCRAQVGCRVQRQKRQRTVQRVPLNQAMLVGEVVN